MFPAPSISYHSIGIYWYVIKWWPLKHYVSGSFTVILREYLWCFGCKKEVAKCCSNETDQKSVQTSLVILRKNGQTLAINTRKWTTRTSQCKRQKCSDFIGNAIGVIKDVKCLPKSMIIIRSPVGTHTSCFGIKLGLRSTACSWLNWQLQGPGDQIKPQVHSGDIPRYHTYIVYRDIIPGNVENCLLLLRLKVFP